MNKLNPNQSMINLMVKCMLNPNNKSFYIGTLTIDTLKRVINGDSEMAEVIFTAYGIAQSKYLANRPVQLSFIEPADSVCPECGCNLGYSPFVPCPNCDYVED